MLYFNLTQKHWTRLERPDRDSALAYYEILVIAVVESFITLDPGVSVMKPFS
jgi:hypothetical protein